MPRAVRNALLVAALVALVLVVREALTSEETRVRRAIEGGVDAFNEGDVLSCVRRLHAGFEHRSPPRIDRALLAQGLIAYFREHRDTGTEALNARASLTEGTLAIEVAPEGGSGQATATFELVIEERDGVEAPWEVRWRAGVDARLVRETLGWVVREVESTTRAGRVPR